MKKLFSVFGAILLGVQAIFATDLQPEQNEKGQWGFVDSSGFPVVDYRYDAVTPFDGDYAKVCKNQKWGYINQSGIEVLKPEYQEITDFADGVARVMKGNKYGFINEQLEFIIPCKFSTIGQFNANDLIWVADGNKYGIYRKDGKVIIEPKFKSIGTFIPFNRVFNKSDFEKDSYAYTSHYRLNGSHHLLRKSKLDFTPFSKIPDNPIGFYSSAKVDGSKNSVIDPSGRVLLNGGKYYCAFYPTDGLMLVKKKEYGDWGFINLSTDQWVNNRYISDAWAFQNGVAIVKQIVTYTENGEFRCKPKWIFLTKDGTPATDKFYDDIFPMVNGVYVTFKASPDGTPKYGMCDVNGNEIIPPSYNAIISTTGNYFAAQRNEGDPYGFLDNRGQWSIEPTYSKVLAEPNGYHCVMKNNKWGAIDRSGVEVVGCEWDDLIKPTEADQKIIWVAAGTDDAKRFKAYSVDKRKLAFNKEFVDAFNFDTHYPDIALVHNGIGQYGCIDTNGTIIVPLELDDFDMVRKGYEMMQERGSKTWRPIDTHRIRLAETAKNNSYRLSQKLSNDQWEY